MTYRTDGSSATRRRELTMKLVSVAPRSSRLNSASLPRLRSHPIQRPSLGFQRRSRWKKKKRSGAVPRVELVDAAASRAATSASSSGSDGCVGVGKVAEQREVQMRIAVGQEADLEVVEQAEQPRLRVDDRRHDDDRAVVRRECRRASPASAAAAAGSAR